MNSIMNLRSYDSSYFLTVKPPAKSDHLHSDSRWMGIRIAWLRQCIQDLLVNIVWRSGTEQLADIMTKVLPAADYNTLRTLLMNLRYLDANGT